MKNDERGAEEYTEKCPEATEGLSERKERKRSRSTYGQVGYGKDSERLGKVRKGFGKWSPDIYPPFKGVTSSAREEWVQAGKGYYQKQRLEHVERLRDASDRSPQEVPEHERHPKAPKNCVPPRTPPI